MASAIGIMFNFSSVSQKYLPPLSIRFHRRFTTPRAAHTPFTLGANTAGVRGASGSPHWNLTLSCTSLSPSGASGVVLWCRGIVSATRWCLYGQIPPYIAANRYGPHTLSLPTGRTITLGPGSSPPARHKRVSNPHSPGTRREKRF